MLSRLFFILFVIFIFWGLNAFVVLHLYKFFTFKVDKYFFLITIGLASLVPLSMVLHSGYPSLITTGFYYVVMIWLGTIFFGFCISVIFDITINFLPLTNFVKGLIWASLIVGISAFSVYNESGLPVIKNIAIKVNNLGQSVRIGYLSDVHIDGIHSIDYLDKIVDILNKQNVDIVMINGDLIDGTSFETHSFKTLDRLKVPVYFTYGNHESYINKTFAQKLLADTKVKILENEVAEFNGLQIIGIEDMAGMNTKTNEEKLKKILLNLKLNKDKPSLMLLHEPIGSEIADKYGVNVQLAGHTHNGQIFPFNLLVKLVFPRELGLYKIGNLTLYVGPGTGVWGPPMRLGSQNEITIIDLFKNR